MAQHTHTHTHIYIHTHTHTHTHIYIYIYIYNLIRRVFKFSSQETRMFVVFSECLLYTIYISSIRAGVPDVNLIATFQNELIAFAIEYFPIKGKLIMFSSNWNILLSSYIYKSIYFKTSTHTHTHIYIYIYILINFSYWRIHMHGLRSINRNILNDEYIYIYIYTNR